MESFPSPGTLLFSTATPNPNGAAESELYLFKGNAAAAPVSTIEKEPGVAFPPPPGFSEKQIFTLLIVHFNDLHGRLIRFTPDGDQLIFSRLAWQLSSSREQCRDLPDRAVLALSAGDDCGGAVFDELLVTSNGEKAAHPYYRLYSRLGVDAACIGNHDFDHGVDFLSAAIRREARFPLLAANLKAPPGIQDTIPPAALLVVKGIRVGLIGLITRAETRLPPDRGTIVDPRPVAGALVKVLRPLCDVLVIISHLGYCMETSRVPMADSGDVLLARSLPPGSVDLIVGGHSHSTLNQDSLQSQNVINGIPIVQAGSDGEFVGLVELQLSKYQVSLRSARLIPTKSLAVNEDFETREVQPLKKWAHDLLSKKVGIVEADEDLSTETVRAGFASGELALANYFTDALAARTAAQGQPVDFAMIDASSIQQGFLETAKLSYGDCFEMMPYADTVRIYELTGVQLLELLSENALRLNLPEEEREERGFLQFSSHVRYTIKSGRVRGQSKVLEATINGIPLEEQLDRVFKIATTCFVRTLSMVWESSLEGTLRAQLLQLQEFPFRETDLPLRREITTYIREHGGITAAGGAVRDGRLRIVYP
ncbi:MAG: bifunctional metallophosphatase/5'-nucleotidase [Anaerolineales bacterium]|nr:bifunctional metallophosphatase/5'-nucleotidase [Anaerolineales bacterium]